jgi:uncharacterized protein YjbJ (UPF0337 family)
VSAADKIRNTVEKITGTAKRDTGRAAGDPYLEAEGAAKKKTADVKQAGENVKDAFKR